MAIRAIIFDVGGVLLHLGEQTYRQGIAKRLGLPDIPAEYAEQVPYLQRGEVSEEEVFSRLAGRPVKADAFDDLWLAEFPPDESMVALAREMRERGLRTAILSNTQASHVRLMRQMPFLEGFDPVVFSCEAGCRKPEPEIWHYTLDALQMSPEEAVYIDDVPEYVGTAMRLGIRAIRHIGDTDATRRTLLALLGATTG